MGARKTVSVPVTSSITTQMLRRVFALYIGVAVLLLAASCAYEYYRLQSEYQQKLVRLADAVTPALAVAVYNVDHELSATMVNNLEKLDYVTGLRVVTEFQGTIRAGSDIIATHDPALVELASSDSRGNIFWHTVPIIFSAQGDRARIVGNLTLFTNRSIIFNDLIARFGEMLAVAFFQALAFLGICLAVGRTMLSEPLQELARCTRLVGIGNLEHVRVSLKTEGNNELRVLADSFNAMLANMLVSREQSEKLARDLATTGKQLEEANWTLEERVRERVRELDEKNAELKTMVRNLRLARDAAESATRAKSNFLATMSHEIRTPMNVILGMAEVLDEGLYDPVKRERISVLRSAGEGLLSIINDILDLSKIEAGELTIESIPFHIHEEVDKAVRNLAPGAREKGLDVAWRIDPSVPRVLSGDPVRLRQVLINLISNAVKFTHDGEVIVDVFPDKEKGPEGQVMFTVRDTGVGIPDEIRQHIFDEFSQGDSSVTRQYGGTGLGLAICRRLVRCMGGDIYVNPRESGGTEFGFSLQFATVAKSDAKPDAKSDAIFGAEPEVHADGQLLKGRHILVAEPHPFTRDLVEEHLRRFGAVVSTCSALNELGRQLTVLSAAGRDVDAVILAQPEEENDLSPLLSIVSEAGVQRCVVMRYAVARNNRVRQEDTTQEPESVSWVMKPVNPDELGKTLTALFKKTTAAVMAEQVSSNGDLRPLKILLVDDSPNNRLVVELFLKDTPHEIVVAQNGVEGVDEFQKGLFDVVLMDIEMPEMDGLTATEQIRRMEKESGAEPTPVIMLTAHALKEEREKAIRAGCSGFLTKPLRKNVLLDELSLL